MFGLGMMEIGVIVVLAVLLFPAKELPKLVRTIARLYGQVRKVAEDFRSTVLEDEDLREPIDQIRGAYNDARWEVRDAERKARKELAKAQMDMRMATARRIQADRENEKAKLAEGEPGEASDSEPGDEAESAAPATPVQIAANSGATGPQAVAASTRDDQEPAGGPVAGADPRRIAAPRPPAYTAPSMSNATSAGDHDDEPREGVG